MLDGAPVAGLDLVENIGTDAIGRVTLGDNERRRPLDGVRQP